MISWPRQHLSAAEAARIEQIQWQQRYGAPGPPMPSVPSGPDVFDDFCRHLDFEVAAELRLGHLLRQRALDDPAARA